MTLEPADITFVVFLLVVIWLAIEIDGDWGGGKRGRVLVPAR